MTPLVGLLYIPVGVWITVGIGLLVAFKRSTPTVVLRLAASFLALWALLATTTLLWVLSNGGWVAVISLLHSPLSILDARYVRFWAEGALGAFVVFLVAFLLSQLVGRGILTLLRPKPLEWPSSLPRPAERASLLSFRSYRAEAFSYTLLRAGGSGNLRPHREEIILLSEGLIERLNTGEREAVIAHELGHILGLDGRYLTFLRTMARMMCWDPLLAYLAFSLTRREEYRADVEAVRITRRPLALARALFKASTLSASEIDPLVGSFLGADGRRGREETLERIRRLVELSESGLYSEDPSA